jgi:pyridoxamine 5'-phosphate oxidase
MVVATATAEGRPSARVVLCKKLVVAPGYVVFFTNYQSRKGAELDANPEAAAVLHWDDLARQVRLEGRVLRSPDEESDEYFASRALDSRIGAWASLQSQPLDSRGTLLRRVAVEAARHGTQVPRPPHWGGYRLWPRVVELWLEGPFRVHDRARWTRELDLSDPARPRPGPWQATRLYP